MIDSYQALILAAGKSSRFNTNKTKLSYTICGLEMIIYPLKALKQIGLKTTLVVGYQKEVLTQIIDNHQLAIDYIEQKEQLGTGHAVKEAIPSLNSENIVILNGDMPLVSEKIISGLIEEHENSNSTISFAVAHSTDSTGYGRVVRTPMGIKIVEHIDFDENPEDYPYVNAGIYIVKRDFLIKTIENLEQKENTKEFYITSLIEMADSQKESILSLEVPFNYVRGINTLEELYLTEELMTSEIIRNWMLTGIRFTNPQNVYIDYNVEIGSNSTISSGVQLRNNTQIGSGCYIDTCSVLDNTKIEDNTKILPFSVISNSIISQNCEIGPFANIKGNSTIAENAIIGNFVEINRSSINKNSKIKHLSYIGDSKIGSKVNVGAGTITCNYDGAKKHTTNIKDNCFIGSNSSLIAPITIGQNSVIAAGSVITDNVPEDSLAIARSRQTTKEDYILQKEYIASQKTNNLADNL